jgi:hypothetical protein
LPDYTDMTALSTFFKDFPWAQRAIAAILVWLSLWLLLTFPAYLLRNLFRNLRVQLGEACAGVIQTWRDSRAQRAKAATSVITRPLFELNDMGRRLWVHAVRSTRAAASALERQINVANANLQRADQQFQSVTGTVQDA